MTSVSDSEEKQVHTDTMLVHDECAWFARTAIMLNWAQSQRRQSVLLHDDLSLAVPTGLVSWSEGRIWMK